MASRARSLLRGLRRLGRDRRSRRTSDTVSVRYQGRPIMIIERQSYGYRPKTDGRSSPAE